jgi:hypothetical protein
MKKLVLIAILAACGGSKTGPTTTTTTDNQARPALPDIPFESMDHEQQKQFMAERVMPAMGPLFVNHDPKKFPKLECVTCHGKGAETGKFEMPNPDLPKLNFADMSKFKKEDVEWMGKEIEPTMAKTLNLPVYSEDNPTGFGCLGCHTQAQ